MSPFDSQWGRSNAMTQPTPGRMDYAIYAEFGGLPPPWLALGMPGRWVDRYSEALSIQTVDDIQTALRVIDSEAPSAIVANVADQQFNGLLNVVDNLSIPIAVIAFTTYPDAVATQRLVRRGVHSVLVARLKPEVERAALQLITTGARYAPVDLLSDSDDTSELDALLNQMPARLQSVAIYISHGLSNKEIASRLGLTEVTIKVYASQLFRRMGVRNRTEAAAKILALNK